MSVETSDLLQSLAYTNTVNKPVKRKTHHTQFPETPFVLTISVTKLGVSVEKVWTQIYGPERRIRYTKNGIQRGKSNIKKKAIVQLSEGDTIDFYNNI